MQDVQQEPQVRSLGQEDPLEEGTGTHSSRLAWRIPWTEEPGELQSMGHKELDTTERIHFTSLIGSMENSPSLMSSST